METGVVGPVVSPRQEVNNGGSSNKKEVQHEAHPNHYNGLAVSPNLAHKFDNDVANREGKQAAGDIDGPDSNLLGFKNVRCDEHYREEQSLLQEADAQLR